MQRSPKLMQYAARIMLFSRQNCSLCESAKKALNNVGKIRGFEYHEVDVMAAGNEQWKAAYEFDAPVMHVQRLPANTGLAHATEVGKVFHRISQEDIEVLLDEAESLS